jgi:hypothetical protein
LLILKGSQQTADVICDLLQDRKHRMRTRPGVCPSGQTPGYHLRSLQDQSKISANHCEATFQLIGSCVVNILGADHSGRLRGHTHLLSLCLDKADKSQSSRHIPCAVHLESLEILKSGRHDGACLLLLSVVSAMYPPDFKRTRKILGCKPCYRALTIS